MLLNKKLLIQEQIQQQTNNNQPYLWGTARGNAEPSSADLILPPTPTLVQSKTGKREENQKCKTTEIWKTFKLFTLVMNSFTKTKHPQQSTLNLLKK